MIGSLLFLHRQGLSKKSRLAPFPCGGESGFRYITTHYFYFSLAACQVADPASCLEVLAGHVAGISSDESGHQQNGGVFFRYS